MNFYKDILLAVDGSNNAYKAVTELIEIQKKFKCRAVVFYAFKMKFPVIIAAPSSAATSSAYYLPNDYLWKIQNELETAGKTILNEIKKKCNNENLMIETRLIKGLNPEEYIMKIVKKEPFDLIILGYENKKYSRLKKIFKKTVAQKILNKVQCDLLIIQ